MHGDRGYGPRVGKGAFPSRASLGPLQGTCSQREAGWWHYEVCHGFNVTQYRPKPVEKCVGCLPERTQVKPVPAPSLASRAHCRLMALV